MEDSLRDAYEHCQRITREQAKNFYYAFLTLPRARRQAIYATYAFCRLCDDVADSALEAEEKVAGLGEVTRSLEQAEAGRPEGPVFQAVAHVAATYDVPWEYFHEVVRGVEMDITVHRYSTFEELQTYCYRVASVVGLICVRIFGCSSPEAREPAIALGVAMQLTNILRDVAEDGANGRVYLPQEDIQRFGYSDDELLRGVFNDRFVSLMRFQVQRAREQFQQGKALLPLLPLRSRACPAVLGGIYSRLLDRIEAQGYDVYAKRVSLSGREKLLLMVRLWLQSLLPIRRLATAW